MAIFNFSNSRAKQFDALVRPLLPQLYRQAYRFCGHRQNAEDLVQELLTRLYAKENPLAEKENLKTWLTKALYHQFIDSIRKQKQEHFVTSGELAEMELLTIPCPQGSAEEITLKYLEQQQIETAMSKLNAEQRAVLVLHDMEGYTLNELEPVLEAPLGTLKSRLHRARQQMRHLLLMEPFEAEKRVEQ